MFPSCRSLVLAVLVLQGHKQGVLWRRPGKHVQERTAEHEDVKRLRVLCVVRAEGVLTAFGRQAEVVLPNLTAFGRRAKVVLPSIAINCRQQVLVQRWFGPKVRARHALKICELHGHVLSILSSRLGELQRDAIERQVVMNLFDPRLVKVIDCLQRVPHDTVERLIDLLASLPHNKLVPCHRCADVVLEDVEHEVLPVEGVFCIPLAGVEAWHHG
mmetsp:Transcript_69836/g.197876  ORF Transcript_69836/g.197876 Transcript_69836/m.197876 type:complete len:215 (+) Transcript_69836:500-1144(+)